MASNQSYFYPVPPASALVPYYSNTAEYAYNANYANGNGNTLPPPQPQPVQGHQQQLMQQQQLPPPPPYSAPHLIQNSGGGVFTWNANMNGLGVYSANPTAITATASVGYGQGNVLDRLLGPDPFQQQPQQQQPRPGNGNGGGGNVHDSNSANANFLHTFESQVAFLAETMGNHAIKSNRYHT